ncbi:35579_t:CDS:2, partial [Racocetra persica]
LKQLTIDITNEYKQLEKKDIIPVEKQLKILEELREQRYKDYEIAEEKRRFLRDSIKRTNKEFDNIYLTQLKTIQTTNDQLEKEYQVFEYLEKVKEVLQEIPLKRNQILEIPNEKRNQL